MSKTSPINEIIQQLDTLSLEQLLEVRERVNALIMGKVPESEPYKILYSGLSRTALTLIGQPGMGRSKDLASLLHSNPSERKYLFVLDGEDTPSRYVDAEDETLEDAIKLVDEWMSDESGYDEETYPQIEAALNQNRLSL